MTTSTLEHQIGPRGRFTLRQASGEIAIRGVEGDTVRVRSRDGDRALGEQFTIETGKASSSSARSSASGSASGCSARATRPSSRSRCPTAPRSRSRARAPSIEASDLSGTKPFRTASGDTKLRRLAGAVEVETVSGDIEIEGQAPIDLTGRSVSGDVRVRVPRSGGSTWARRPATSGSTPSCRATVRSPCARSAVT